MAIIDGDGDDAVTSYCFALLLPFLLLVVESIEVDGVGEGKDGFERKRERKGKKKMQLWRNMTTSGSLGIWNRFL